MSHYSRAVIGRGLCSYNMITTSVLVVRYMGRVYRHNAMLT